MYSIVSEIQVLTPRAKDEPGNALVARVDLHPGEVIRVEHTGQGEVLCLADNPITGPFSHPSDIVGRVVALAIPRGTVITGAYLEALGPAQINSRLRNFWRRCK